MEDAEVHPLGYNPQVQVLKDEEGRVQKLNIKGREYVPLHPELFTLSPEFFEDKLNEAVQLGTKEAFLSVIEDQPVFGVFSFPCLKPEFCRLLLEELDHLERSGVEMRRPNSMNRYGVIMEAVGFSALIRGMLDKYILPMSSVFFPDNGGADIKYHHAFTVRYKLGEDKELKKHVDNSDITLNVCLGKEFEGGDLLFQGCKDSAIMKVPAKMHAYMREEKEALVRHKVGHALLHLGSHIHSAKKLVSGERVNLIIWCKAEAF
ncbi:putative 2oxoglutarate and iron-dependent oxygenase domain containing protein 2 [Balamuthia mandrillaris]